MNTSEPASWPTTWTTSAPERRRRVSHSPAQRLAILFRRDCPTTLTGGATTRDRLYLSVAAPAASTNASTSTADVQPTGTPERRSRLQYGSLRRGG